MYIYVHILLYYILLLLYIILFLSSDLFFFHSSCFPSPSHPIVPPLSFFTFILILSHSVLFSPFPSYVQSSSIIPFLPIYSSLPFLSSVSSPLPSHLLFHLTSQSFPICSLLSFSSSVQSSPHLFFTSRFPINIPILFRSISLQFFPNILLPSILCSSIFQASSQIYPPTIYLSFTLPIQSFISFYTCRCLLFDTYILEVFVFCSLFLIFKVSSVLVKGCSCLVVFVLAFELMKG